MLCSVATKRGKWSMSDRQQAHSDELSPVTCSPHTPAEQSRSCVGKSPMSKSSTQYHSARQGSTQSACACEEDVVPSEGIFKQPCGQAYNPDPSLPRVLQATRPFLKAHMAKRPELLGSADLRCSMTDPKAMAEEIRQHQQQSFRHLMERQSL